MFAFLVMALGGIVEIQYDSSRIHQLPANPYPGEPILPVDIMKFPLPENARDIRLVLDDIQMEEVGGYGSIGFNDRIVMARSNGDSVIQLPRVPHPSPVVLEGYGRKRDSIIAVVRINPLYFDGKDLHRIRRVAFHLEWNTAPGVESMALPDSLDYLILTVSWLHPYVDSIAYLAQIRGFRTLIIDVDDIATNPKLVRDTIKYYYRNFGIRYASIVAHASIIHPYLLRFHPDSVLSWYYPTGPLLFTDFPFMALDGEYYSSQDEFVGDGDDGTDMVADIGFSRIPVSNIVELRDYYIKLKKHVMGEGSTTPASLTCLESRLDSDTTSFAWLCESAIYGLGIPRVQRMYEPYFDYLLTPEEFFDSLNTLKPQIFIYLGHSNIDRILTTFLPRQDIFTSTYYALMDEFTIPITYIGGCWPGDPMSASMTVNLPRVDGKGSLFTMGSSKLDYASNELMKARGLLEYLFLIGGPFASDAVNHVRLDYVGRRYFLYEIMTYGDPTLTIFRSDPSPPPAQILLSTRDVGIVAYEDSMILSIIRPEGYDRYVIMEGDTAIRLPYEEPETLTISLWKPGYVPIIRKVYFVPDGIVFGRPFMNGDALPGDTMIIRIPVFNHTDRAISSSLQLESDGAVLLNDHVDIALPPRSSDTTEVAVIPRTQETFTLRLIHPDGTHRTYRFPVISRIPRMVGVRWSSDSAAVDLFNPSPSTLTIRVVSPHEDLEVMLGPNRVSTVSLYAPESPMTIEVKMADLVIRKNLSRKDGPDPPKSVRLMGIPSGIQLHMTTMSPATSVFRIYRKRDGDIRGYQFAGLTEPGSRVFVDHPENYGRYCYRVSALDDYMNEGPLSDEVCGNPGPDYGFMKPISYAEQLYAQPVPGQFDRTTSALELFIAGNAHMGFYHHDGTPYDGFPALTMFEVRAKPVVVDYDGDGFEEVIVSGKSALNGRSYLLAVGLDGTDTLYSSDHGYDFALAGGLLAADIAGDSLPEIILKTYYGNDPYEPRFILLKGDSILFQFRLNGDAFNTIIPAAGDVDSDGKAELIFMDEDRKVYALNGDSSMVNGFPVDLSADIPGTINYTEVFGTDSLLLVISRTGDGYLYLSKITHDGLYLGTIQLASGLAHYYWQHTAIGYMDADSILDLVIPTRDSLIVVNMEGNRLAPSLYQYLRGPYTLSSPLIVDVGFDGRQDIVFSNASMIQVYEYSDGSLTEYPGFPLVMADDSTMDSEGLFPPFVADMNSDGFGELYVAMNRLGYVYQIESPGARATSWPEEFGNRWNTNWYGFQPPSVPVSSTEDPGMKTLGISFAPGFILLQGEPGTPYEIHIYTASGRKIMEASGILLQSGNRRIPLDLPSGIYVLKARLGSRTITNKFVNVR